MNPRFVVIDEPIHVYDPKACKLWQETLWAKEKGYRNAYKSNVLPMGEDDFVATHLIIADEKPNGDLVPVVMYKSLKQSTCKKFNIEFKAMSLLKGTKFENSLELGRVLKDPRDISYDSSWTINPEYKRDKEFSKYLRDLTTIMITNYHKNFNVPRWVTAGVIKYKIDQYFEFVGGKELLPEFKLDIIDGDSVRMLYIDDVSVDPAGTIPVNKKYGHLFDDTLVFTPNVQGVLKDLRGELTPNVSVA